MKYLFPIPFFCLPLFLFSQTPDSLAVAKEADSLIQRSLQELLQGKREKAFQTIEIAKQKAESAFTQTSPVYANCLHGQLELYIKTRKFAEAVPVCKMAAEIREKKLGKDHPDFAKSINYLATFYRELGQYDEAFPLAFQAKEIRAKNPGVESREYAITLHLIANLFHRTGEPKEAKSYYLESKTILEKIGLRQSMEYAILKGNLAVLFTDWGKYDKDVENFFVEALTDLKKNPGENSEVYATTLNNLAWLYVNSAQFFKAEAYSKKALQIIEGLRGKDNEIYLSALNALAAAYLEQGFYDGSEQLYLEALDILQRLKLNEQRTQAGILLNLGVLYNEIGQYDRAESNYLKTKTILEKFPAKNEVELATCLTNLGALYYQTGRIAEATPLLTEAKAIREKVYDHDSAEYAASLNNMAELFFFSKNYPEAERFFLEAKDVYFKVLGADHPLYAYSIKKLGRYYAVTGDLIKAESSYLEAKEILKRSLGVKHPYYVDVLSFLASFYHSTNQPTEAAPLYLEMNGIIRSLIEEGAKYLSEKQLLGYIQTYEEDLADFHRFTQSIQTPEFICASYDNALFYNGYLLENIRQLKSSIEVADSLTRDTFDRWQGCKRRFIDESVKRYAEHQDLDEIEAEAERYEKSLNHKLPAFSEIQNIPRWKDIRPHLTEGTVAIEFIKYNFSNPNQPDSSMYAALVLQPGDSICPHFIPLCDQKELNKLLQRKYPDKRYERIQNGNSLYSLLWQPIEPFLKGISTIYYVPVSSMHTINFDAIVVDQYRYVTLIDQYKLVRLNSTRRLFKPLEAHKSENNALLFGGILYDSISISIVSPNRIHEAPKRGLDDSFELTDSTQKAKIFKPIPGTLKEVKDIEQLLISKNIQVRKFTGFEASEEAFYSFADSMSASGKSARIIHLATHGYFSELPKSNRNSSMETLEGHPVYIVSKHPLLRSGLIMAGGNHAWQTGKPLKQGMEDGILTAYEISTMSLKNTELVVLSACKSGLGDIYGEEGVFGLQRAFKIAGAPYLIMSLWSVPDEVTKVLMSTFYQNWLGKNMDITEAFRSAQLRLKNIENNPEKWAGFILVQ